MASYPKAGVGDKLGCGHVNGAAHQPLHGLPGFTVAQHEHFGKLAEPGVLSRKKNRLTELVRELARVLAAILFQIAFDELAGCGIHANTVGPSCPPTGGFVNPADRPTDGNIGMSRINPGYGQRGRAAQSQAAAAILGRAAAERTSGGDWKSHGTARGARPRPAIWCSTRIPFPTLRGPTLQAMGSDRIGMMFDQALPAEALTRRELALSRQRVAELTRELQQAQRDTERAQREHEALQAEHEAALHRAASQRSDLDRTRDRVEELERMNMDAWAQVRHANLQLADAVQCARELDPDYRPPAVPSENQFALCDDEGNFPDRDEVVVTWNRPKGGSARMVLAADLASLLDSYGKACAELRDAPGRETSETAKALRQQAADALRDCRSISGKRASALIRTYRDGPAVGPGL